LPVELIFNPNWWFRNYGISFDRPFYFDREVRIANDIAMRRALFERFGLGEADPRPRPVIGSQLVAGGFVVPALLGVEIRFERNQAPCPLPANLKRERIMALRVPDVESTWPMNLWIAQMDALERDFGFVIGDFNTDGVINTALQLRGQDLFVDMVEDEELTGHLFSVVMETQARVAEYARSRTGTCSVAVNRGIVNVDPAIYLHANCSAQMISPALFRRTLLRWELALAERLRPYGIHHCGDNCHLFAKAYGEAGPVFVDVGWGSDVAKVRAALPRAFLNLRLSPMRMLSRSAAEIRADGEALLNAAGHGNSGLCCSNMDYGTPDENVRAMIEAAGSTKLKADAGAGAPGSVPLL
jgi:hypothetical protein